MKGFGMLAGVVVMVMMSIVVSTQLVLLNSDIDKGLKDLTREDKVIDFVQLENQDEYVFNKYDALFMMMNNIEDPDFEIEIDGVKLEYKGFNEDLPPSEIFKQVISNSGFASIPDNAKYKYTQEIIKVGGKELKRIEFKRK